MSEKEIAQSVLPLLSSKDIRESRERVDKAVEIFRESTFFTRADFDEALKRVSQRIGRSKSSPKQSET